MQKGKRYIYAIYIAQDLSQSLTIIGRLESLRGELLPWLGCTRDSSELGRTSRDATTDDVGSRRRAGLVCRACTQPDARDAVSSRAGRARARRAIAFRRGARQTHMDDDERATPRGTRRRCRRSPWCDGERVARASRARCRAGALLAFGERGDVATRCVAVECLRSAGALLRDSWRVRPPQVSRNHGGHVAGK